MARKPLRLGVAYDFRNPPEFGLTHQALYAAIMDQVAWLDGLGLDLVWFTEHHFVDDGYLPSWIPVAAAMAARTKQVRFSCDVCLLPFNHPVRLAEDLAVLDNISGGRVEMGVGMGYAPHEFRGFGMPVSRRVSLTDEGIEVLQRAFTGEKFSFEGKRYNFQDVKITPGYVQPGGPPLWIAAMAEAGALRAARFGTNLLPQGRAGALARSVAGEARGGGARSRRPSHRHHPLLPRHRRPRARLGGGAGRRAAAHGDLQQVPRRGRRARRRRRHHRVRAHPADLGGGRRRPLRRRALVLHRAVRPDRHRELGRAARHAAGRDESPASNATPAKSRRGSGRSSPDSYAQVSPGSSRMASPSPSWAVVVLARLLARAAARCARLVGIASQVAIALLFFLQGARLSRARGAGRHPALAAASDDLRHHLRRLSLARAGAAASLGHAARPAALCRPAVPLHAALDGAGLGDLHLGRRRQCGGGAVQRLAVEHHRHGADAAAGRRSCCRPTGESRSTGSPRSPCKCCCRSCAGQALQAPARAVDAAAPEDGAAGRYRLDHADGLWRDQRGDRVGHVVAACRSRASSCWRWSTAPCWR